MVPVLAVPSSAVSTYLRARSLTLTWPILFGGILRITLPPGPTIALATRGS